MQFDNIFVNCSVTFSNDYKNITISGTVKNASQFNQMLLIAPNPIDRMSNYSGSGLPFPCGDIAFDNSPNKYIIEKNGYFNVIFKYPNSYYAQDGKTKIVSSIFFILDYGNNGNSNKEFIRFELKDLCVLRTLADRQSKFKGPEYYAARDYLLPLDTAENVMRAYSTAKVEFDIA
jgi:hypothetical protein